MNVDDAAGVSRQLFIARVSRVRGTYTFTSRMFVRGTAQYVATDRDRSLYTFARSPKSGTVSGQVLLSYKLNWQSVHVRRLRRRPDAVDPGPLREGRPPVLRQALLRPPTLAADMCIMTHPQPRSDRRRMPARWASSVALALVARPGRGRAGTRDYRNGPSRICGELGVARGAVDRLDEPAAAMGGHARRLHGGGRRRSSGVRAERRGHRRARMDLAAALPCASRRDGGSRPPRICTAHARGAGRVSAARRLRAMRCRRRLSNRPSVARPAHLHRRQGS